MIQMAVGTVALIQAPLHGSAGRGALCALRVQLGVFSSACSLPLQDFVAHQAEEEGVILPAVASVLSAVSCYLR